MALLFNSESMRFVAEVYPDVMKMLFILLSQAAVYSWYYSLIATFEVEMEIDSIFEVGMTIKLFEFW